MTEITPAEKESLETILKQFESIKQRSVTNLEYLFSLRFYLLQRDSSPSLFENDLTQRGVYVLHKEKVRTFLFVSGNYAGIERNEPTYSIATESGKLVFYRSAMNIGEVYSPHQNHQEFVIIANELNALPNDDKLAHYFFLALARSELGKKE